VKEPKAVTAKNAEIDAHELLSQEQRQLCKTLRNDSRSKGYPFAMFDFAKIALRARARDYSEADTGMTERDLQRAAILYVYEALKATDLAIIKEWPEFDEMLRNLEYLFGDLPP
jgi:hypothetical protein